MKKLEDTNSESSEELSKNVPTGENQTATDSVEKSGSNDGDGPDRQKATGHVPHDMRNEGGNGDGLSSDSEDGSESDECPECGAEPRKTDGDCDCDERLVIKTILITTCVSYIVT